MVSIEINNSFLNVYSDQLKFNITFRNSIFGALNSHVFNFSVPNTVHNARIIGFPLHLNRIVRDKIKCKGSIHLDGFSLSGTFTACESGEGFIGLSFEFMADDFTAFSLNKRLPEVFDETISVKDIISHVEETVLKCWPETDYQFPSVLNPDFYGNENPAFLGVINNFEHVFLTKTVNGNTIVPMVFLPAIILRVFNLAGYKVMGAIFEDDLFKKALIYNHYALDYLVTEYFKGNLFNADVSDATNHIIVCNANIENVGFNYNLTSGKYQINTSGSYRLQIYITHRPYSTPVDVIFVCEIVHEATLVHIIRSEDGTFPAGSNNSITTVMDVTHFVMENDPGSLFVRLKYFEDGVLVSLFVLQAEIQITSANSASVNIFQNSFNLKNHVPDIPVLDFLDMFFNQFQVFPVFDNVSKTVSLISFSRIMKSIQPVDLSKNLIRDSLKVDQNQFDGLEFSFAFNGSDAALASCDKPNRIDHLCSVWPNSLDWPYHTVFYVAVLNAYYTKKWDESLNTIVYPVVADNQPAFRIDHAAERIDLDFAPLVMRNHFNSQYAALSMPAISCQGTSEAFQLNNEAPLRILFYIGFGTGVTNLINSYPFATTTRYDSMANVVLPINCTAAEFANRYWDQTIAWLRHRIKIEFQAYLTANELLRLAFHKKQMLLDSHFLIEEAFAEIDRDLKYVQIKGFTG